MLRKPSKEGAAVAALFSPHSVWDEFPNAILIVDHSHQMVVYANPVAEVSLDLSSKLLEGMSLHDLFGQNPELFQMLDAIKTEEIASQRQDLILNSGPARADHDPINAHVVVGALNHPDLLLIEWFPLEQQLRSERDDRLVQQVEANKTLMRNLAHEIKNPLGGIRGAAQLLEYELPDKALHEYTQVIINESDRLQSLVDRLLAPHRKAHIDDFLNIHEVLERVRSLVLAEFPQGLKIKRNYDISLPDLLGDKEALIQAVLNVVHNAAQALRARIEQGDAEIELSTRVVRNVTINKQRYKLALDLHVIDNGPGIPDEIKDKIFFPLVSGKEGGSGLGLTLAQTYVQQNYGFIGCTSKPGTTDFQMQLPFRLKTEGKQ
jgi:two-component system, NtrC family, nitrogen regulation sensor histidine kinase GlnL